MAGYREEMNQAVFGFGKTLLCMRGTFTRGLTAGLITARFLLLSSVSRQRGFSLTETLVALLLMAIGISALLHYHHALTVSFNQQWQQQQAWWIAMRFPGEQLLSGWHTTVTRMAGPSGCIWTIREIKGPQRGRAKLRELNCETLSAKMNLRE